MYLPNYYKERNEEQDEVIFPSRAQGRVTTDTTILECNERIILLIDNTTCLNEVSINIHFTDVVDNNGKLNTFLVGNNL